MTDDEKEIDVKPSERPYQELKKQMEVLKRIQNDPNPDDMPSFKQLQELDDALEGTDGELAEESTQALADELQEIALRTTDDGHIECKIAGVEPDRNDRIKLSVELPTQDIVTFRLEKPVPWSEEYLFARIVDSCGYGAGDIGRLEGERIYLERADDPDIDEFTPRAHYRSARHATPIPAGEELGQRSNGWKLVDPAPEKAPRDGVPIWKEHSLPLAVAGLTGAVVMAAHTIAYWTALTVGQTLQLSVVAVMMAGLGYMIYDLYRGVSF